MSGDGEVMLLDDPRPISTDDRSSISEEAEDAFYVGQRGKRHLCPPKVRFDEGKQPELVG